MVKLTKAPPPVPEEPQPSGWWFSNTVPSGQKPRSVGAGDANKQPYMGSLLRDETTTSPLGQYRHNGDLSVPFGDANEKGVPHYHKDERGLLVECYHKAKSFGWTSFLLGVTLSFPVEHYLWEKVPPFAWVAKWLLG